jgi:N-acetyl-alpha-D-muramate 1-phosphate uridylyltransferase
VTLPVAILAGGLATRMRPLTERIPKSLLDVAGQPFVFRQLSCLARRGVKRVVFCVGFLGELVREAVGDGARWGIEAAWSFDGPKLLGTAGALRKAMPLLDDRFLVLYGDSYLDCDYAAVERAFLDSGRQGIMTVYENAGRWDGSNVQMRDGRIEIYDKKTQTPGMRHIDYGLGGLSEDVLLSCDEHTPCDLAGVYQELVAKGELAAYEMRERFYEIGSPSGLEEMRRYFTDKDGRT